MGRQIAQWYEERREKRNLRLSWNSSPECRRHPRITIAGRDRWGKSGIFSGHPGIAREYPSRDKRATTG